MLGFQSHFFETMPLSYFQPECVIFFAVWFALKRELLEGGILILFAAYITELHSAAPKGILMAAALTVFLALRLVNNTVQLTSRAQLVVGFAFSAILYRVMVLVGLSFLNAFHNDVWTTVRLLGPTTLTHAALALPFLKLFQKIDQGTLKDPRSAVRMESDFYIDEEFI
jgi:hypothetical protein